MKKRFNSGDKYVITTDSGKKLGSGCSVEHVEYIGESRRKGSRYAIWVRQNDGSYSVYRRRIV